MHPFLAAILTITKRSVLVAIVAAALFHTHTYADVSGDSFPGPSVPPGVERYPLAKDVLHLAPESTMAAVIIPPVATLYGNIDALVTRLDTAGCGLKAAWNAATEWIAQHASTPEARTWQDILEAKGLSSRASCGLFVDYSCACAKNQDILAALKPGATPQLGPIKTVAAEPSGNEWFDPNQADLLLLLYCSDPTRAEATLLAIVSQYLQAPSFQPADYHGYTIRTCPYLSYALAGSWLLVANTPSMMEDTLRRLATPAAQIPETFSVPPSAHDDDLLLVSRLDRLTALVPDIASVFLSDSSPNAPGNTAIERLLQHPPDLFAGTGPTILTLSIADSHVELDSRLDLSQRHAYLSHYGKPAPLRLAACLSELSWAWADLRLAEETKRSISTRWLPLLDTFDGFPPLVTAAQDILAAMGEEVAIAILPPSPINAPNAPSMTPLPGFCLVATTPTPDVLKQRLAVLAPGLNGAWEETTPGMRVLEYPVPLYTSLWCGLTGNAFLIATEKTTLDHAAKTMSNDGKPAPAGYLPDGYGYCVAQASLFTGLAPLLPEALGDTVRPCLEMIREVRAGKVVEAGWQRLFLSIDLK